MDHYLGHIVISPWIVSLLSKDCLCERMGGPSIPFLTRGFEIHFEKIKRKLFLFIFAFELYKSRFSIEVKDSHESV